MSKPVVRLTDPLNMTIVVDREVKQHSYKQTILKLPYFKQPINLN